MKADIVFKYFNSLTETQKQRFLRLEDLYQDWNQKINVVSRKDIDELYLRHVLHSLGIAKVQQFNEGAAILDVGTGGGFPGIPLAILFPETQFTLVDAIGKKIKVVQEVIDALKLDNVTAHHSRVEELHGRFDFIVSRAVAAMPTFVRWTKGKIKKDSAHERKNGILYLKGGNLDEELRGYTNVQLFELSGYFDHPFFDTKKVVYLPQKFKG
ncbi:MAG: 16S rRNA (guanine(527)-N(7))-methyltransferase RsmG [Muricauda sp.]|uniref:Ribosomal RNA small subunit methyltransferase G n=1 Tax=Flagellimonas lutaonensis TaxID=516051 RepID=A0A0D5YTS5_9FLAO|nr:MULTISPECIES: 16S rRNA (guanine(527)-N(7))-methyltransferase RsmG [Allomuricauda]AKA35727.1 16S rRNA methyltransferase [Allomuricauda lutaonensis]MAU26305.1 16S rRNA (guanine(527)-N(7))-methyltransferase RsmG [Allomuricauda sp.]MBC32107.1 16S rRNA (guanine(527)-N(7))-methyltransferase RsmG [Allomuricauda sp.]|tara:strand:+ start:402 stop:1037 length:636 start_codon:yes stop_codon:yes gene_type:complete